MQILDGHSAAISCQDGMPKSRREIASSEQKLLSYYRIFPPRKKNALSRVDIIKMQILDGRSAAISRQDGIPKSRREIASSEQKLLSNIESFLLAKKRVFASGYYKNEIPTQLQRSDLPSRWNAKIQTGDCFVGGKAS